MKQLMIWITVGLLVVGTMTFAWTQAEPPPAARAACAGCDDGCSGGTREMRHGQMLVPVGAYLEVNEASGSLWEQIGELQETLHEQIWELSVLYDQRATVEECQTKAEQVRMLIEELRTRQREVREHLVLPEGKFQGMREDGRGDGGGHGRDHRPGAY